MSVLQAAELEGGREALRQDNATLQRRVGELEDEGRLRDKEQGRALEELRAAERALAEQRRRLEVQVDKLGTEVASLQLRLREAEGRAHTFEEQLAWAERGRLGAQGNLGVILSTLRRNMGLAGGAASPVRARSPSPSRKGGLRAGSVSPSRFVSLLQGGDMDMDGLRLTISQFFQHLTGLEKERV